MPVYGYLCETCGPFEQVRPMSQYQAPAACPTCSASSERMVTAVQLNLMQGNRRIAHSLNERNAHEPRIASGGHGHRHAGHDKTCEHKHNHSHQSKYQTSARPWQVGH